MFVFTYKGAAKKLLDGAVVMTPGQSFTLPDIATSHKYDLQNWYINSAENDDGVNVIVLGAN